MSHITFYRKYRSRTFAEIVGQEHIIQTLVNAIAHDRLGHAYIFAGPRGTGKTSCARILAKSLNCRNGKSDTPCLTCDLCQRINNGNSMDVIEIDAASNNGVDNIRVLNEQVNFTAVECRFKIYIIDEAHMLSTGAFNALLKTLEEPPANTLFILATTEQHKIPITIQSRCQKLNFRKLTQAEIIRQLQVICTGENLTTDDKALAIIARNSSGCMRDAISLLDQIYSFKGTTITVSDVLAILGTTDTDTLIQLMDAFFQKNAEAAMGQLMTCVESGINVTQLIRDIVDLIRNLLFVKMKLINQVDLDAERLAKLQKLADQNSISDMQHALETFAKTEMELKWFPNPDLLLQVRFLTLMHGTQPAGTPTGGAVAGPAQQTAAALPQQRQATPVQTPSAAKPAYAPQPAKPIEQPQPAAALATPTRAFDHDIPDEIPSQPSAAFSAPASAAPPVQTPPQPPSPSQTGAGSSVEWNKFLTLCRQKASSLYMILITTKFVRVDQDRIVYDFPDNAAKFFVEKMKEQNTQNILNPLLSEAYRRPVKLVCAKEIVSAMPQVTATDSQGAQAAPPNRKHQLKNINQLIEMFEGRIV